MQNKEGQTDALESGNKGDALCSEVTATPAHEQIVHAEQVSPAISLATSPSTDENYKIESDGDKSSNQSGTGNVKPNCYKCKYRGGVPGSAHSSCRHPAASPIYLLVFTAGKGGFTSPTISIQGNTHGVRSGWFFWPLNFDPVWLEQCTGFEEKS
jgi:hypothetical protein